MDESKSKAKKQKAERRYSQEQFERLNRCSAKEDMSEWNEWRIENPKEEILLEGAALWHAYLRGANLERAHLREADLRGANLRAVNLMYAKLTWARLQDARFLGAHLEGAILEGGHLEGANFCGTHLQGAHFETALVDGATSFWKIEIDRKTSFLGVSLDTVRIHPEKKQLLEYNIRRMNWEKWYARHCRLKWLVKPFWWMSDYGKSLWRIAWTFFLLASAFAAVYANCDWLCSDGIISNLGVEPHMPLWHYGVLLVVRPIYFSIVTMTTLGFGDMYANAESIWGHILLTIQVILGYVLLGALVTRFAVLFTAGGPAGTFADEKEEDKAKEGR